MDRWTPALQPPKVDVNAPDLYIPVCATGLLVTLHALQEALLGTFTPLSVHSDVTWFVLTWLFQVTATLCP